METNKMKKEKSHYETDRYFKTFVKMLKNGTLYSYLKYYIKFVRKNVKKNSKILDLGCGLGLSSYLLSKNYDVIGADSSRPFIGYAKKHFKNVKYKREDARKLSFRDKTFDVVSACGVIEHIKEVNEVLSEMLRVTKKNGLIILVSPSWFSPLRAVKGLINPKGFETIGRNRLQITGWLLKSIYYSFQKLISPGYIFKNPDIFGEKLISHDIDMVYIANPYDLKKFFEKEGCEVLKLSADTFPYSSIPNLSPWLGVVAKKLR
tara:strand:- start:33 stop:818 length:786 start_codon:yes stop_codon:yes gene_type:complete